MEWPCEASPLAGSFLLELQASLSCSLPGFGTPRLPAWKMGALGKPLRVSLPCFQAYPTVVVKAGGAPSPTGGGWAGPLTKAGNSNISAFLAPPPPRVSLAVLSARDPGRPSELGCPNGPRRSSRRHLHLSETELALWGVGGSGLSPQEPAAGCPRSLPVSPATSVSIW